MTQLKLLFVLGIALTLLLGGPESAKGNVMKEIRTYMPFTFPVDPAKIVTIPDMNLSYALASTLVEWDAEKQITAALAEKWSIVGDHSFRFTLRKNIRWSDGHALTAQEAKQSLLRGMKAHPKDLRSLVNLLDSIECTSDRELVFKLKVPASESGLLGKLTEPNFGITKVSGNGKLDLSTTTGAFYIKSGAEDELTLEVNPHWHRHQAGMADRIMVRRTPISLDAQTALLQDPWPNLMETSSLISEEVLSRYNNDKFQIWRRPEDKVFLVQLSRARADENHFALLRYLREKLNRKHLISGLSGVSLTQQIFPLGYTLHDLNDPIATNASSLPETFKKRPLEIVFPQGRINSTLQENLRRELITITGHEPKWLPIPLQDSNQAKLAGNFDVFISTMGLADPDPEGVMSFYFEGETPVVPSSKYDDFVSRLDQARKTSQLEERLSKMKAIASDAVKKGHVLPLFHLSTIGVGRSELDFSQVPTSDESVTLSKIRFRSQAAK